MSNSQTPSNQGRNDAQNGKGQQDTRTWSYQDRQAYVGAYKNEQNQSGKK